MRAFEERLTFVEGQVREHTVMIEHIGREIAGLRGDMNRRFDAVDRRFDAVDHRLTWVVGLQVMTLGALVTALAAILSTA